CLSQHGQKPPATRSGAKSSVRAVIRAVGEGTATKNRQRGVANAPQNQAGSTSSASTSTSSGVSLNRVMRKCERRKEKVPPTPFSRPQFATTEAIPTSRLNSGAESSTIISLSSAPPLSFSLIITDFSPGSVGARKP